MRTTMKTVMRVSANITLTGILCIDSMSLASAFDPTTGPTTSAVILLPPEVGPIQPFDGKTIGLPAAPQTDLIVMSFGLTEDRRMTYTVEPREI